MKPMYLLWAVLLLHCTESACQNLINNGSFDEVKPYTHRDNHSQTRAHFTKNTRFWDTPTAGTPDIVLNSYREDPKYDSDLGPVTPRTGESMIGMRIFGCYRDGAPHCREYIQTKTIETLQKGKCYEYEYYTVSNAHAIRINNLGIGFSEFQINDMSRQLTLDLEYIFEEEKIVDDGVGKWVKISGTFSPEQDYNHVIIGNYQNDKLTKRKREEASGRYGYYYIDDVSLYKIDCTTGKRMGDTNTFTLENVLFDINSHHLTPKGRITIKNLYDTIVETKYKTLTIHGYTDNSGPDLYNQRLSQKRAESVLHELELLGIEKDKMQAIGHGSSKSIDSKNKSKNRRVEISVN